MIFEQVKKSVFIKSVTTLSLGTVSANIITVGASLFLTRIYSPQEIGFLSLFTSFTIVLTNIFTLGYELAIVHPKSKLKASQLTVGTFLLLFILSFFLLLLIQLYNFDSSLGIPKNWLIYLPFGILFLGIINILQEWFNRVQKYRVLSIGKILQALLTVIPQIFIGYFFTLNIGLVIGYILGRFSSSFIYFWTFLKGQNLTKLKINEITESLKEYKKYPKYISPTLILDRLSIEAPYFLIPFIFDEVQLGFFAIAYRVLSVPLSFIGISIGQVFFKFLTAKKQESKELLPPLIKTWVALAIIGTLPVGVILIGGSQLFELVFGAGWGFSGIIAIYLVPMLYLDFISSPTGRTFLVIELEHYSPIFSIARLIYIPGSLYLGYVLDNFILGIIFLSALRSIALIVQNLILFLKLGGMITNIIRVHRK